MTFQKLNSSIGNDAFNKKSLLEIKLLEYDIFE